jgi:hypothetical protein
VDHHDPSSDHDDVLVVWIINKQKTYIVLYTEYTYAAFSGSACMPNSFSPYHHDTKVFRTTLIQINLTSSPELGQQCDKIRPDHLWAEAHRKNIRKALAVVKFPKGAKVLKTTIRRF